MFNRQIENMGLGLFLILVSGSFLISICLTQKGIGQGHERRVRCQGFASILLTLAALSFASIETAIHVLSRTELKIYYREAELKDGTLITVQAVGLPQWSFNIWPPIALGNVHGPDANADVWLYFREGVEDGGISVSLEPGFARVYHEQVYPPVHPDERRPILRFSAWVRTVPLSIPAKLRVYYDDGKRIEKTFTLHIEASPQ